MLSEPLCMASLTLIPRIANARKEVYDALSEIKGSTEYVVNEVEKFGLMEIFIKIPLKMLEEMDKLARNPENPYDQMKMLALLCRFKVILKILNSGRFRRRMSALNAKLKASGKFGPEFEEKMKSINERIGMIGIEEIMKDAEKEGYSYSKLTGIHSLKKLVEMFTNDLSLMRSVTR